MALLHKRGMANDPAFGERLKQAIARAGYKNPRRFALEGMEWPEGSGPQRVQNYLAGRIPDIETVVRMADVLGMSLSELIGIAEPSAAHDESLRDILQHLLALENIPGDKADTIASAALEAQRLLRAFPEEEPLPVRTKFAARAAWIQQRPPAHGM